MAYPAGMHAELQAYKPYIKNGLTKADKEWESLLSLLSSDQKQHLDHELNSTRLRGTSYRGINGVAGYRN